MRPQGYQQTDRRRGFLCRFVGCNQFIEQFPPMQSLNQYM